MLKTFFLFSPFLLFSSFFFLLSSSLLADTIGIEKKWALLYKEGDVFASAKCPFDKKRFSEIIDSLWQLSKPIDYALGLGNYYFFKGIAEYNEDHLQKAEMYLDSSIYYFEKVVNKDKNKFIGPAKQKLISIYSKEGRLTKAIQSTIDLIKIRESQNKKGNQTYGIHGQMLGLSALYQRAGKFDSCFINYFNALRYAEKNNCDSCVFNTYHYLMLTYMYIDECEHAKEYLLKAMADTLKATRIELYYFYGSLAEYYMTCERDYVKSEKYLLKTIQRLTEINNYSVIIVYQMHLAAVQVKLNKYNEAEALYKQVLDSSTYYKNESRQKDALLGLAEMESNQEHWENALDYYTKALPIVEKINDHLILPKTYKNISDVNRKLKKYEAAYVYYQKYSELKDSIFNVEKVKSFKDLELQYQTEKKEAEIINLKKENEQGLLNEKNQRQIRSLLIILFVIVIFIVFLFYNRYKTKQKHKLENAELKASKEIIELEQKLLLTQMNPHFIFNSLQSIETYIIKNNPEKASEYLTDFSKLMRLILESSREEFVDLSDELSILKYYLKLEQLRLNFSFDYTIEMDENIQPIENEIQLPPMLIQPFVENAIKHGITNINYKGAIRIQLKKIENHLSIEVKDNGIGRKKSGSNTPYNHKSLAFTITEERLAVFYKKYHKKIEIELADVLNEEQEIQGTAVSIKIPLLQIYS